MGNRQNQFFFYLIKHLNYVANTSKYQNIKTIYIIAPTKLNKPSILLSGSSTITREGRTDFVLNNIFLKSNTFVHVCKPMADF